MTEQEIITTTQMLIGDTSDRPDQKDLLPYIYLAKAKILNRLYPFGGDAQDIPTKYHIVQCELAARLFLRKGSEGETHHNENGVSRSYESVDDADILLKIVPIVGVF